MASASPLRTRSLIVVAALLAMAAGYWLSSSLLLSGKQPQPDIQGAILEPPRQIAVPELTRHDGQPFGNTDLKGDWTLIFFGYTSCPDICPMTMNVLAEAKKKAGAGFPRVVMVSVDPQRDTLTTLGEYVHYFDEDFTGVTGDEKMIQALTLQMSVVYMKMPGASGNENDYLVDHSSAVLLINPQGQLAAFLNGPHTPASINESIRKVRASYQS